MTFGSGGASETGELFSVSRVSVLATEPPDQQPQANDEFHVRLEIHGVPREHILLMDRAVLEKFVKDARKELQGWG